MSDRNVRRMLNELEQAGWLTIRAAADAVWPDLATLIPIRAVGTDNPDRYVRV